MNPAKHETKKSDYSKDERLWNAFHSKDMEKQNDFKLRYALEGTSLWGAYMTDVLKDYRESYSPRVEDYMKTNKGNNHFNTSKNDFLKELEILKADSNTVIIAFGNAAFNNLKKMMQGASLQCKLAKVCHYSYRISKEKYREKIIKQLRDQGIVIV